MLRYPIKGRGGSGAEQEGKEWPHQSVQMATSTRYLTDRHYVTRKPLFSSEPQTSCLKKTQELSEKEKRLSPRPGEQTDKKSWSRATEMLVPESRSFCPRDVCPPTASREDSSSPLTLSELTALHRGSRPALQTFSRSILEVQRVPPPLRPPLTSTVLYPTYTPRSGHSRPSQTPLRLAGGGGGGGQNDNLCTYGGKSEGGPESYQAAYWACAIPKALPPSPDRQSAAWSPDKEYQTLLDYTYPLRPGQGLGQWDTSEHQDDACLQTQSYLQDSGIGLDHLGSSVSLSGLDLSTTERRSLGAGQRSTDHSSGDQPHSSSRSLTNRLTEAVDHWGCSEDGGVSGPGGRSSFHPQHQALSFTFTPTLPSSSSLLPLSRDLCRELEEEFWALPESLEDPRLLATQVREVTAQLSQPVTASWDSLEPGTASILSSTTQLYRHTADQEEDGAAVREDRGEANKPGREQSSLTNTAGSRDSSSVGAWVEPAGGGLRESAVREVEALDERLRGLSLPGSRRKSQEQQQESLMHHIQAFCSHLALLIQQLYVLSDRIQQLAAPTVDLDSVKSSLAEYQVFQREVSSYQPLTSCVLQSGQLLLSCINSTSPLLRDALLLVERQSGALQGHSQHFLSSILSAMDSLTRPGGDPTDTQGPTLSTS